MKKRLIGSALALGLLVCIHAGATPRCEFDSPTSDSWNYTYAHYFCGGWGCTRLWYANMGDLYAATTDDDPNLPCGFVWSWTAQEPFFFTVDHVAPFLMLIRSQSDTGIPPGGLPPSCYNGLCVRTGAVSVMAITPGLPSVHHRPYLFVMTYIF